jgi:DNA-binding MarR family transcriptional regulator
MSSRDANLVGACALAVAGRLPASAADTALVALDGWLSGTTVDGLARVLALTHSGAVRLTDRLAGDGLVERRAGADARSRALHVTAAGSAEAARLRAERFAALEDVLGVLDAAERETLTGIVERLLAGITRAGAAPGRTCRLCDADVCGHPDRCPVTLAGHP